MAAESASGKRYCDVAVPHTRLHELTYEFDPELLPELGPGDCVKVRLRGRKVRALVMATRDRSPVARTLSVEELVESRLVSPELLELLRWVGAYYFGRMGEVLGLALPRGICGYGLRRKRAVVAETQPALAREAAAPSGGFRVRVATCDIDSAVTEQVRQTLERGSVIVLAPEYRAASLADRLRQEFGQIPVAYHGDLKAAERKRIWRELRGCVRQVVVGVRAAVFAPVPDFAGVVVLDEHDTTFKEERHPRINARDVAVARAKLADVPVLLCDPTPSVETWFNLKQESYQLSASDSPGTDPAVRSELAGLSSSVIDMRRHRDEVFAPLLVRALERVTRDNRNAVLYINRKGLSRHVVCQDCGHTFACPECGVGMVLGGSSLLVCRYCGRSEGAPEACPGCHGREFAYRAPGVERVVREVARCLPDVRISAVQSESSSEPASPVGIPSGDGSATGTRPSVLVGTRALLHKDWPEPVGLVSVISLDDDLCRPDFRAGERTFQTVFELAVRAVAHQARLLIQTRRPDDPALSFALSGDVAGFLNKELELREGLGFPPCRRLALITFEGRDAAGSNAQADRIRVRLARARGVEVLGPVPVRGRKNACRLLVKLPRSTRLDRLVTPAQLETSRVGAKVDVDPFEVS